MYTPPTTGNNDLDSFLYQVYLDVTGQVTGDNLVSNSTDGTIKDPAGVIVGYLYRYIHVKYADDNVGTGLSNSPTGKDYYGIYNSDSSTESTTPASYTWYKTATNMGTTDFLWYKSVGGRKINLFIGATPEDANWIRDDGAVIDLDLFYTTLRLVVERNLDIVQATDSGVVSALPAATVAKVYRGDIQVTDNVVFSGTATQTGLTLTINATTGVITFSQTSWLSDTEIFTITATVLGTTYTDTYTMAKAKSGTNGTSGSNGSDGVRGTVQAHISQAWDSSAPLAAFNAIRAICNASGSVPNYPIKGDIVFYTGGAKECTSASSNYALVGWGAVTAYIDGSLVVSGSLAADRITAGTISAMVSIDSAGGITSTGAMAAYGLNPASTVTVIGGFTNLESSIEAIGSSAVSNTINYRAGLHAKASATNSTNNIGVLGEATNGSINPSGHGVVGSGTASGGYFECTSGLGYGLYAKNANNSAQAFWADGGSKFTGPMVALSSINAAGDVTAYGSSDRRLKKNINNITDAVNKVEKLNGVMFDWKASYIKKAGGVDGYFVREHDTGVIAQEVLVIMPEVVGERPDGTLAVKYEKLVPLLIESIKELNQRIKILENK